MSAPCKERQRAALLTHLATHHTGADCGITAAALARTLALSERHVRTLVSDARLEGVAVCGTPDTGYYIARTAAELEQCCAFLRSRAMHSLRIEAQLRRVPLPDLLGQLHLPT